ncbi:PLC-like phosphodiesterase [Lasiosphaeria hispida]|uniref:PLC-like phosphodiesterase n=1 Tax=Lasiosphaeria hispida TaxID=260671 RepID=A0AAJ0H5X5_9PEZI|nr:PLC-like phosphodiesterase [Lasiosphaeria hispida]
MGAVLSTHPHHHPIYLASETMGNLTIRNLTITPLELKQVERLTKAPARAQLSGTSGLAKITARITGRKTEPPAPTPTATAADPQASHGPAPGERQDISDVVLQPFSESATPIAPPDSSRDEQLHLTFEEAGTGHRYIAEIPGPSPSSVVMRHASATGDSTADPSGKEFTVVYLPRAAFLSVFSSANLSSWMAALPPSLPLSSLSIPGTHNSPTHYVALPSVRCQAVPVREQLDNGVRFLDIRVSCPDEASGDDLALVHSAFPISLSGSKWFHDLLAEVYAFLDAHPSETVLMSVKREGNGKGSEQLLSRHLARRYMTPDKWYTEPRIPSLGEARGRVVLVRRFHLDDSLKGEHGGAGLGIDGSVWPDNCADGTCGSGMIRIQDFYEVGQTEDIDKKIDLARAELERAAQQACVLPQTKGQGGGPLPFFINFLSASSFFNASCWPDRIAAKINPFIIEYLCTGHGAPGKGPGQLTIGDAGTGIVVMDWVGNNGDWDLVRCIVGWNARLQLKQ